MSLGNRDVIIRHLFAIAFGAADPGLAGRMLTYVSPKGVVDQTQVDSLIAAVRDQTGHVVRMAEEAWGTDVLDNAGLTVDALTAELEDLPTKIRHVVDCTARQVSDLYTTVQVFAEGLAARGESPSL